MELFTIAWQTDNSDDIDFLLDTLNNLNQEIEMEQKKENNANVIEHIHQNSYENDGRNDGKKENEIVARTKGFAKNGRRIESMGTHRSWLQIDRF